ncbi:DUF2470 domain-containing protein [Nocardiopsis algeriensis]|uniref:DUF2470 domain-containing protein n=1 Tax=Nocardiopsis algeriensis TaxID=1478215 RepID=A0A841ILP1_9ACTN|nr:hypothetical protein [Nocardiopsis algeriensis]
MVPLYPSQPAPSPAERARSVLARSVPVTVATQDSALHLLDPVCHVHPGGTVSVLLPDRHSLLEELAGGRVAATFEFTDTCPVPLRDPARSLLWIGGTLTALDHATARARALHTMRTDPDERMLDIGHGRTMAVLDPYLVVHSDTEGCHLLETGDFVRARPGPLGRGEDAWLRHLEEEHPEVLQVLAERCVAPLPLGRPRLLGVDRYGLALRFEAPDGDRDVRVPFDRPAETGDDVAERMRALVGPTRGCAPF